MARPAKPLVEHVRERTFRARQHAHLLAGAALEWHALAALQRQYRDSPDAGDRYAIALEFERAVACAHRQVLASNEGSETSNTPTKDGAGVSARSSSPERAQTLPRLALSPNEAAHALGVSRDFFDQHIAPELRIVRRGRRKLVDIRELQRWLSEESLFALERTT
jgi:hypothetical protein